MFCKTALNAEQLTALYNDNCIYSIVNFECESMHYNTNYVSLIFHTDGEEDDILRSRDGSTSSSVTNQPGSAKQTLLRGNEIPLTPGSPDFRAGAIRRFLSISELEENDSENEVCNIHTTLLGLKMFPMFKRLCF